MSYLTVPQIVTMAKDVALLVGALGAGLWFLYTRQHKRRVSWHLEATSLPLLPEAGYRGLELRFVFSNEGERQQRVQKLIFQLEVPVVPGSAPEFDTHVGWQLLASRALQTPLLDDATRIRSGTQQTMSAMLAVPVHIHIVRVTVQLDPKDGGDWQADTRIPYPAKATLRRHFALEPLEAPARGFPERSQDSLK